MHRPATLLVFFITLCTFARAQPGRIGAARKEFYPVKHKITTRPQELLVLNLPLSYEYVKGRHTVGVHLAYRPQLLDGGFFASFGNRAVTGDYSYNAFRNQLYQSVTAGVNSKFYFFRRLTSHTKKDVFIDLDIFYRKWWFDKKQVEYPGDHEIASYQGIRSEQIDIGGFKTLIGQSLLFNTDKTVKQVVDLYVGFGARYKIMKLETFDGYVADTYYPYHAYNNNKWYPSFHIGLNYGIGL